VTCGRKGRGLAAAAFAGALLASGCTFHPGQAAVVDGSNISQSTVDDLVQAGCAFFKAQRLASGGAQPTTSTSYLRHLFTQNLIAFTIVDKAASRLHLTVSPAAVAKVSANESLLAGMHGKDRARLEEFFTMSTRADLQRAVIGAHLNNPSVTTADHVTQSQIAESRSYLKKFTLEQQVSVNPAYGTWRHGQLLDTDGSLSAAESPAARKWLSLRAANSSGNPDSVAALPPSQVCG
jgi:hypothetical protein